MNCTRKKYRYERKYIIKEDAAYLLAQRIAYVLLPDKHSKNGQYYISSLYFDDVYNTSFYEKQNGVLTRDKFRVRFYNKSLNTIRLECKHKHGEMIYKEGALIEPEQFQMMCRGDYSFMKKRTDSVFEKFYTAHSIRLMRPVITVGYNRQAFMHPAGNVRITFDSGLSASMPMAKHSFSIAPDKNVILEVKYDHFIPSHIAGLLTGVPFTQQLAISKFVMAKLALQGR